MLHVVDVQKVTSLQVWKSDEGKEDHAALIAEAKSWTERESMVFILEREMNQVTGIQRPLIDYSDLFDSHVGKEKGMLMFVLVLFCLLSVFAGVEVFRIENFLPTRIPEGSLPRLSKKHVNNAVDR